jgi:ADP-heptose:LPS heptosyltransferase
VARHKHYDLIIFKPDNIGDFILATSAIEVLQEKFAGKAIAAVVSSKVVDLARQLFPAIEFIPIDTAIGPLRNIARFAARTAPILSRCSADYLVSLRYCWRECDYLGLRWLRARSLVGLCALGSCGMMAPFALLPEEPPNHDDWLCRELCRHAAVLRAMGLGNAAESLRPCWPGARDDGYLLVAPFATNPIREYPLKYWAEFLERMTRQVARPIVVTGEQTQIEFARELAGLLARRRIDITLKFDLALSEYIDLVKYASGVVTVESSAAHIATAFDKKTVVLIGGGHFREFAPWRRSLRQIWLTHELKCFGCNWHCVRTRNECIDLLDPKMLTKTMISLLNEKGSL